MIQQQMLFQQTEETKPELVATPEPQNKIHFVVDGEPVAKGRARTVKNKWTGDTHSFTPDKTILYENLIKMSFKETHPNQLPLLGMLKIEVIAYFSMPQSASNIKREKMLNGEIRPTKKPDADNIIKIICDALNRIAYDDDKQVVDVRLQKFYAEKARISISIDEI